ncbi:hypothetical protein, partial [Rhizocola hellebori]|uniref:hypothetical protein n=1 Tax=Rhizocola hellebori TaxID=1392758 RepID=UPI001941DD6F
ELGDQYSAASTYQQLGETLVALERPDDALTAFLKCAGAQYEAVEAWPQKTLAAIQAISATIPPNEFTTAIDEVIPPELTAGFLKALADTTAATTEAGAG